MTGFIKLGGVLVIAAVLGIFVFILFQIFPLFRTAEVREVKTIQLPQARFSILGVDEWGKLPFLIEPDGKVLLVNAETGEMAESPIDFGHAEAPEITAASINKREQKLIVGTANGQFAIVEMNYTSQDVNGVQVVSAAPRADTLRTAGIEDCPVIGIAYGDSGRQKLVVALQQNGDSVRATATVFRRHQTLMGLGEEELVGTHDLTPMLDGRPNKILVSASGDEVVTVSEGGQVTYLALRGDTFTKLQTFVPFEDLENPEIAVAQFLFGDVSLVLGSKTGENRIFSLYYPEGQSVRLFGFTQQFPDLETVPTFLATTLRNKAFLIGGGNQVSLRFRTTESVRWSETLPFTAKDAVFSGKYARILLLDAENRLHVYDLNDPHPDSGWRALFAKLWYEGSAAPKWEWQSTGGSDEFEPKYSLVPIVFGTLKGTLYAMCFAVPIALLAAVYTSQFLDSKTRSVIKPTMEIMASLPSVVLGFLAAIYIAPLVEHQVPSLLLVIAGLPVFTMLFGWFWSSLPIRIRKQIRPGTEWLVFLPVLLGVSWVLWQMGPAFERLAFATVDPETGKRLADFRYWWPAVTGASFDQRNSMVVGFMMGFAVIPIIFTIAEDSMSNVPTSLRSASMACGASRWQTALLVVLPTASAGIFSALMIGLGRAVGETMIVVMATGNTPIMEWNPFSGMRTLSANIAVELPEAPQSGTLYRTLFFGAMLLFLLTFAVNTVAEILRQHLREKYKTI